MNDSDLSHFQPHHHPYMRKLAAIVQRICASDDDFKGDLGEFMLMQKNGPTATEMNTLIENVSNAYSQARDLLANPPTGMDAHQDHLDHLTRSLNASHAAFRKNVKMFRTKIYTLDTNDASVPDWLTVHEGIDGSDFINRLMNVPAFDDQEDIAPAISTREVASHSPQILPIPYEEMQERLRNAGVVIETPIIAKGSAAIASPTLVATTPAAIVSAKDKTTTAGDVACIILALPFATVFGLWWVSCMLADPIVAFGEWLSSAGRFTPGKAGVYLGLRYGGGERMHTASNVMGGTMGVCMLVGMVLRQKWIVVPTLMFYMMKAVFWTMPVSVAHMAATIFSV